MMMNDVLIGGDTEAIERLFDEFLDHMSQFDKKLSLQTQKIILRNAVAPAVRSLRAATRRTWQKRTGRAWRSVKTTTKNSKTRPGVAYTTYGWSDRGIKPEFYTSRRGTLRQRPKPATYIGIWGDLGTVKQPGKGIFRSEWQNQKSAIQETISRAIIRIMRESKLSK
jgi:hypothetical protein